MAMIEAANRVLKRVPTLPLYALALLPGLWVFYLALGGGLGADPMRTLEHELGLWAFRFMMAALVVTPLREHAGLNLIRFRRMLGLTAFFYALFHLSVYLLLDRQLAWAEIGTDLAKRPYIIFGMSAFALLLPLALTSNNLSVARMGAAAWRRLHKLAYPAAVLMVLHYLLLVKSWTFEPLAYAAGMSLLLALRLLPKGRQGNRRAPRAVRSAG